jgi:all-trans-retinol dehydrogenase (NAD+)
VHLSRYLSLSLTLSSSIIQAIIMIRCFMLIVACIALHGVGPLLLTRSDGRLLSPITTDTLHWYLKWSLTLWAAFDINSLLNRWADNRWLFRNDISGWDWKKEIAVVTGGSSGIGACVVKKLVSYGISCAVLDVVPLSENFTKGEVYLSSLQRSAI